MFSKGLPVFHDLENKKIKHKKKFAVKKAYCTYYHEDPPQFTVHLNKYNRCKLSSRKLKHSNITLQVNPYIFTTLNMPSFDKRIL